MCVPKSSNWQEVFLTHTHTHLPPTSLGFPCNDAWPHPWAQKQTKCACLRTVIALEQLPEMSQPSQWPSWDPAELRHRGCQKSFQLWQPWPRLPSLLSDSSPYCLQCFPKFTFWSSLLVILNPSSFQPLGHWQKTVGSPWKGQEEQPRSS